MLLSKPLCSLLKGFCYKFCFAFYTRVGKSKYKVQASDGNGAGVNVKVVKNAQIMLKRACLMRV